MTEIDKAYLLAVEIETKSLESSPSKFIDDYGWVQDPDSPEGKSKFKLWPEQKRALADIVLHRLLCILKARQLGITWLVLWYALHGMLFRVGYTVVALSRRDDDAMELVNRMRFMLKNLPPWLCVEGKVYIPGYTGVVWNATAHEVEIIRADGEASRFIAMPASQDSGRSFTASLVILDEWAFQQYATQIWTAAYPTINRPTGGKVIGLSTAKRLTLFHEIWDKFKDFGFHRVFLGWRADPRRDDAWYEASKKALAAGQKYMQEYPSTPEEAFSAGEGTAFPEFSRDLHVCEPFVIPMHWRRWMSCDNGYADPFAWYWFAVSDDGQVYIYREYSRYRDSEKIHYTTQARRVMELSEQVHIDEYGVEVPGYEKIDFIATGVDAWSTHHRDEQGKDMTDYYREGGLAYGLIRAVTDRRLRKATWHEYLKPYEGPGGKLTAKVQIFDTCTHLIENLPNLLADEKDREKVADSEIDNQYDSAGYGIIAYHASKSHEPPPPKSAVQLHKERLIKAQKGRRKLL